MHIKTLTAMALALGSFVTSSAVLAEGTGRVSLGDFMLSRSPAIAPSTRIDYTLASEVDFDSVSGGFSYERLDLSIPLAAPLYLNDCHALVFALDYDATWLDTDTALGDMDLHDLRLSIRWMFRQPGSRWSWTTVLSPGIATDGESINGDDFVLSGQAGFRYRQSERFAWLGGVVFFVDSMETRIFPGLGFQWMPKDNVFVRLSGPNLQVSWQPHDNWILHAGISSGGGTWNVEQNGSSFDVRLKSYQAAVGVERRLTDKVWLGLWGGATFANDLEIETASGNNLFNEDAEAGWFVRLGIRKVVW